VGRAIAADELGDTLDVAIKKRLADAGLTAATAAGRPIATCGSDDTCASS
jgi:hypothetical protein